MKKKITIGLFIDSFFPMVDGVINVVDNYAKRLLKVANVIVFAPKVAGNKFDDSVFPYKVVRCKSLKLHIIDYSMPMPDLDRAFKKELNKYDLDIIHIHSPFMIGMMALRYAKKKHIPIVGTFHSQFRQDFERSTKSKIVANKMLKKIMKVFNSCDECYAVNSLIKDLYVNDYGYKKVPLVMNNATDIKLIDSKEANDLINKRHNIKASDKVFLFVGRINNLKNVFFIANSLFELKKMKPNFNFKMVYVGTGQDEDELKSIIHKNGMDDDIIMAGKITDRHLLSCYYNRADLFLFPSMYDASSLVQVEAASQKTPTLFLEGALTAGTIEPEVSGYISKNSTLEYAEKIVEILSDEKKYKSVCNKAYEDVYVTWDDTVKKVYDRYIYWIDKYKDN